MGFYFSNKSDFTVINPCLLDKENKNKWIIATEKLSKIILHIYYLGMKKKSRIKWKQI